MAKTWQRLRKDAAKWVELQKLVGLNSEKTIEIVKQRLWILIDNAFKDIGYRWAEPSGLACEFGAGLAWPKLCSYTQAWPTFWTDLAKTLWHVKLTKWFSACCVHGNLLGDNDRQNHLFFPWDMFSTPSTNQTRSCRQPTTGLGRWATAQEARGLGPPKPPNKKGITLQWKPRPTRWTLKTLPTLNWTRSLQG